eukprot:CAMPEP_0182442208 /NCGR_PEP_ID=MMETSP1172-20130603/1150_1 /TAXON_ID=708627 /ORGANISM="Timspurckia oligopyrenoides, Strain CCMP3278" /LENGTH=560 /DNA_ID=CAMNT_0024636943 /DNA_START=17 /DNA_END=1699 /DNA_ORIENTATION=-
MIESVGKSVVEEGDYVVLTTSFDSWTFGCVSKSESVRICGRKYSLLPLIGVEWGSYLNLDRKKGLQVDTKSTVPQYDTLLEDKAPLGTENVKIEDGGMDENDNDVEHSGQESEEDLVLDSSEVNARNSGTDMRNEIRDNRHLIDDGEHQKLSRTEIRKLQESGISGEEIVQQIVRGSSTFSTKTEFSQQKYLIKKRKKFMVRVRIMKPSSRTMCAVYFHRNPALILHLRVDSLALMLALANIRPDSKVLVVDQATGLVAGAIAERMQGLGIVLSAFTGQSPPQLEIATKFMHLSSDHKQSIKHIPVHILIKLLQISKNPEDGKRTENGSVHSAENGTENDELLKKKQDSFEEKGVMRLFVDEADRDPLPIYYSRGYLLTNPSERLSRLIKRPRIDRTEQHTESAVEGKVSAENDLENLKASDPDLGDGNSGGQALEAVVRDSARLRVRPTLGILKEWLREGCDSLVVAASCDTLRLLDILLPYISPSGPIVVYSSTIETLAEVRIALVRSGCVARIQIHETFLQNHQVLQGRSHPKMNEHATAGYILSAIKLFSDHPPRE